MANAEHLFKVLNSIQEQIRFADAKAGFVMGLNTVMFGFVSTTCKTWKSGVNSNSAHDAACMMALLFLVYLTCSLIAVGILLTTINPDLGDAPRSKIFFNHIAKDFKRDYARYSAAMASSEDSDWTHDLSSQILETANIANQKHTKVKEALCMTAVAVFFWIFTLVCSMLISNLLLEEKLLKADGNVNEPAVKALVE